MASLDPFQFENFYDNLFSENLQPLPIIFIDQKTQIKSNFAKSKSTHSTEIYDQDCQLLDYVINHGNDRPEEFSEENLQKSKLRELSGNSDVSSTANFKIPDEKIRLNHNKSPTDSGMISDVTNLSVSPPETSKSKKSKQARRKLSGHSTDSGVSHLSRRLDLQPADLAAVEETDTDPETTQLPTLSKQELRRIHDFNRNYTFAGLLRLREEYRQSIVTFNHKLQHQIETRENFKFQRELQISKLGEIAANDHIDDATRIEILKVQADFVIFDEF